MYKIGLKLWSTNMDSSDEAVRLYRDGYINYLELFSVPGSYRDSVETWQALEVPYVIHAPHAMAGLNFARPELWKSNRLLAEESLRFADALSADIVIFHTGLDGFLEETVRQISKIGDPRMIVENKPYYGLNNEICIGSTPEEIDLIIKGTGKRFCFDFGHAICAANALGFEPLEFVRRFLAFDPCLYHLTDGDYSGSYDRHDHYGEGSYPMGTLLDLVPEGAMITNEAKRSDGKGLHEVVADTKALRSYRRI